MEKPLILITNDDSVDAKGIKELTKLASEFGTIYLVAPQYPQSGKSHSITINEPVFLTKIEIEGADYAWKCSGTPVDSIKIALDQLLPKLPDLVLSGINHGGNPSISALYSGTIAGAMEGSLIGINSIAFSNLNYSENADFTASIYYARIIIEKILSNSYPKGICLNVNIPDFPLNKIKGIKVCRQTKGYWKERFEKRKNPHNKEYYWLTGEFITTDTENGHDEGALLENFISIVPLQSDLTSYDAINKLKFLENA